MHTMPTIDFQQVFGPHLYQHVLTLFYDGDALAFHDFALDAQEHSEVFEFAIAVWDATGTLIQRLELPIASADDDQAVAKALSAAEFLTRTGLAQGDPEDIAVLLLHRAIDLITLMPPD